MSIARRLLGRSRTLVPRRARLGRAVARPVAAAAIAATLAAGLLATAWAAHATPPPTCEWAGPTTDGLWSTAGNWTGCGGAPVSGDIVSFPNPGSAVGGGDDDIGSLDLAGLTLTGSDVAFSIDPGTPLTVSGPLSGSGELALSANTVSAQSSADVLNLNAAASGFSGPFDVVSGQVDLGASGALGSGDVNVYPGASVALTPASGSITEPNDLGLGVGYQSPANPPLAALIDLGSSGDSWTGTIGLNPGTEGDDFIGAKAGETFTTGALSGTEQSGDVVTFNGTGPFGTGASAACAGAACTGTVVVGASATDFTGSAYIEAGVVEGGATDALGTGPVTVGTAATPLYGSPTPASLGLAGNVTLDNSSVTVGPAGADAADASIEETTPGDTGVLTAPVTATSGITLGAATGSDNPNDFQFALDPGTLDLAGALTDGGYGITAGSTSTAGASSTGLAGEVELSGANPAQTGAVTVADGILDLAGADPVGGTSATAITVDSGARLQLDSNDGPVTVPDSVSIGAGYELTPGISADAASLVLTGTGSGTLSGNLTIGTGAILGSYGNLDLTGEVSDSGHGFTVGYYSYQDEAAPAPSGIIQLAAQQPRLTGPITIDYGELEAGTFTSFGSGGLTVNTDGQGAQNSTGVGWPGVLVANGAAPTNQLTIQSSYPPARGQVYLGAGAGGGEWAGPISVSNSSLRLTESAAGQTFTLPAGAVTSSTNCGVVIDTPGTVAVDGTGTCPVEQSQGTLQATGSLPGLDMSLVSGNASEGTLEPGDPTGSVTDTSGELNLTSLTLTLDTPTSYSSVVADGSGVTLFGNALLNLDVADDTAPSGTVFTIIQNNTGEAPNGLFWNFQKGTPVTVGPFSFVLNVEDSPPYNVTLTQTDVGGTPPTPPLPPAGGVDPSSGSSTSSNGLTYATSDGTNVYTQGAGSFTVATYAAPPAGLPVIANGSGQYFDVQVAPGSALSTLTIEECPTVAGLGTFGWYDPDTDSWEPVVSQQAEVVEQDGCVLVFLGQFSSPTIAQLTGTVFGNLPAGTELSSPSSPGGSSSPVNVVPNQGTTTTTSTTTPAPPSSTTTTNPPTTAPPTTPPTTTTTVPKPAPTPVTHGGAIGVTPDGTGWWLPGPGGKVASYGSAAELGSESGHRLDAPLVTVVATPDGHGYWAVGSDGGVFAFGDARYYGSTAGRKLAAPISGMAATPDGRGYWLVGRDGGVFAFGDARYHGSAAPSHPAAPVIGIVPTGDGAGYYLVGQDGGVFTYGNARFRGSAQPSRRAAPVVAMALDPAGTGYWVVESNGTVLPFGSAPPGRPATTAPRSGVVGIIGTTHGFVLVDSAGRYYLFPAQSASSSTRHTTR